MSHARINSSDERRRVAIPQPSAKGPLDVGEDDPLSALAPTPAPVQTVERVRSPTRPPPPRSPRPQDVLRTPSAVAPAVTNLPPKDFSFLQDAAAYHVLPASNVPPPFLNAPNIPSVSSPVDTLLLSGHYRLAAIAAARNLVTACAPTDHSTLFHLLHIRLACLCLINEHAMAAQEAKALGDLNSIFYYEDEGARGRKTCLVPWELRILVVRLVALGYGEWRKGIMGYYELARECRENILFLSNSSGEAAEEKNIWRTRLRDCGIRVANVLVEMGDLEGAGQHLASLSDAESASRDVAIMETLVWLRLGDLSSARRCLSSLSADNDLTTRTLAALTHLANSAYTSAIDEFTSLHTDFPADAMVAQNLAVCLLYAGRIAEAKELLLGLVDESQPFHSLVFNLSTVFELCTERNREKKMALAGSVAGRKGDGGVGWEMGNADFKL